MNRLYYELLARKIIFDHNKIRFRGSTIKSRSRQYNAYRQRFFKPAMRRVDAKRFFDEVHRPMVMRNQQTYRAEIGSVVTSPRRFPMREILN